MKINRSFAVGASLLFVQIAIIFTVRTLSFPYVPLKNEPWKVRGNLHGNTFLVEFSDFSCINCAKIQPVLKRLLADIPELRIIFKHFPSGEFSEVAAEASECAGDEGKFWEYQDLLYAHQGQWLTEAKGSPTRNAGPPLLKLAQESGLDLEKFKSCLKSRSKKDVVEQNRSEGVAWLVDATPTLNLDGKRIMTAKTYGELRDTIKKEVARKAQ